MSTFRGLLLITALAASPWLAPMAAAGTIGIVSVFSTLDGRSQFIELGKTSRLTGKTLTSTHDGITRTFTFADDVTAADPLDGFGIALLATQAWQDAATDLLGRPMVADFTLPEGFLATDGGTLTMDDMVTFSFAALPTDGGTMLGLQAGAHVALPVSVENGRIDAVYGTQRARMTGGRWMREVFEYYNAALDQYFYTMDWDEITALDSWEIPGWKYTQHDTFLVSTGSTDATWQPVCRILIPPAAHFLSASAQECAATVAAHPEFIVETDAAFFAALPDAATGACPDGFLALRRLWNGRADGGHRYGTSIAASGGYVLEGYGPNPVAMCTGH